MTHRNLAPEEILPGQLVLRTEGACDLEQQQLIGVWARQRQRFVAVLQGFGPYDWDAPTRCAEWSAHNVVRHLCDCSAIAVGTDEHALDLAAGFDPRVTPRGWPAVSRARRLPAPQGELSVSDRPPKG